MKILLDTSCLIALLIESHAEHARVLAWQQRIARGEMECVISAHSLAETYAVLTRIPHTPPISPQRAWEVISRNLPHWHLVPLNAEEMCLLLEGLSARGIGGGQTYDALIAAAARKDGVDLLLTLNAAHFQSVAPDLADRIQEP